MESSFVAIFIGGAVTAGLAMVLIALSRQRGQGDRPRRATNPRHEPRVGLSVQRSAARLHTDRRTSPSITLATDPADARVEQSTGESAITRNSSRATRTASAGLDLQTQRDTDPPAAVPTSSISLGSSYRVTRQWMTLRNPFTLINDDTWCRRRSTDGTWLFQPPKIVSHSPNRRRSDASFQALSGLKSEETATSTDAMPSPLPHTINPVNG